MLDENLIARTQVSQIHGLLSVSHAAVAAAFSSARQGLPAARPISASRSLSFALEHFNSNPAISSRLFSSNVRLSSSFAAAATSEDLAKQNTFGRVRSYVSAAELFEISMPCSHDPNAAHLKALGLQFRN